jgi:hypothetical protein
MGRVSHWNIRRRLDRIKAQPATSSQFGQLQTVNVAAKFSIMQPFRTDLSIPDFWSSASASLRTRFPAEFQQPTIRHEPDRVGLDVRDRSGARHRKYSHKSRLHGDWDWTRRGGYLPSQPAQQVEGLRGHRDPQCPQRRCEGLGERRPADVVQSGGVPGGPAEPPARVRPWVRCPLPAFRRS